MMIDLFLSKPVRGDGKDADSANLTMPLYSKLEEIIWRLMTSEGRSEARLWFCEAISRLSSITPHEQRDLLMRLLESKPLKLNIAAQVFQMLFERRPQQAGMILAKQCHRLEKFFEGHPKRILQWFSTFSVAGDSAHGKGAKALARFSFVNRDICWEELEWKGKHGQSPAVVATKPHYFLDLDVERTVENFLENVPEFWSSDEFAESLNDGDILSVDNKFFVDFFIRLMYDDNLKEVWEVVGKFFMDESFSYLCQRLLIILDERDLCTLLRMLQDFLTRKKKPNFDNTSYWLEIVIRKCGDQVSIDQLFLLNALFNKGRLLLRLVHSEEEEDQVKIDELASRICANTSEAKSLALISKDHLKSKTIEMMKWLGLLSWSLLYRLSKECCTSESWEGLFVSNNIGFRKSDIYGLKEHDGASDESELEHGYGTVTRTKHKKRRKSKKKRKRNLDYDKFSDEVLLDLDSDNKLSLQSGSSNWLLSTDGYSTSWSMADLPEHLSNHCLRVWMKQTFDSLGDAM